MKLYTEEQIKEAIKMALHGFGIGGIEDTIQVVASKFTPIELPSDREIVHESEFQDGRGRCEFIRGAEWIRNTIRNRAILRNESILKIKK